jgi:hypothetical protein
MKLVAPFFIFAGCAAAVPAKYPISTAAATFALAGGATGGRVAYILRNDNDPAHKVRKEVAQGAAIGAALGVATLAYTPVCVVRGWYDIISRPERFDSYNPKPSLVAEATTNLLKIVEEKQKKRAEREAGNTSI